MRLSQLIVRLFAGNIIFFYGFYNLEFINLIQNQWIRFLISCLIWGTFFILIEISSRGAD